MPKMKSHSGAKKRMRLTGNGLIKRSKQNKNHILTKKTTKRTRNLRKGGYVDKTQEKTMATLLSGQK
jgi:large subunit ribosomal protein L35